MAQGLHQDRDVAGLQVPRPVVVDVRRPGVQQLGHVGGEVLGDPAAQGADRRGAALVDPDMTQPDRLAAGRAHQPGRGVLGRGRDREHRDLRVAQCRPVREHLQRVDQGRVAAPVAGERAAAVGGAYGVEVAEHVTASERVDRLLRVADQDQVGVPGERPVEHLPLHRVGVLELVDQDHLPALPHPLAGRGVGRLEGVGEAAEQVVEAEDAEPLLAPVDLCPHVGGELPALAGHRVRLGRGGLERRPEHVDRPAAEGERDLAAEGWLGRGVAEAGEVEVVDHLHDQVVEVLHQPGVGVGVTGDAQGAQHQPAELVGGRDGGAVEVGERRGQPAAALEDPGVVEAPRQEADQPVVPASRGDIAQRSLGGAELVAHPLAELLAGRPAERDHQQLAEGGPALRDVAGDQGGDGERLPGAGAGLQDRGAAGQLGSVDVERVHQAPLTRSNIGIQSRMARAPKRVVSPSCSSPGRGPPALREANG